MPYRNIIIQNEARLSLENKQIRIKTEKADATMPIEDVDTIVIESRQTIVSTALLAALAQDNVAVFICDEQHMPCALLTPFSQHSRALEVAQNQLDLSVPSKKQMWKSIVTAKISNQAAALALGGNDSAASKLASLARTVQSGDSGYVEGHAAAEYFPALFGSGFVRSDPSDERNSWLNYGYAIIRGCVARHIAAYGFLPMFGIQHHSTLNQFNLADDFIEPYRQIVDLHTARHAARDNILTPEVKRQLVNLINYDIELGGRKYTVSRAIELSVQSFSAICFGRGKQLALPKLIELQMHKYE